MRFDFNDSGNLVNTDTKWNITGSLIKKVDLKESDIFCTAGRTLYIPVRFPLVLWYSLIFENLFLSGTRHSRMRWTSAKRWESVEVS